MSASTAMPHTSIFRKNRGAFAAIILLALLPFIPPFSQEYMIRWLIMGAFLAAQAVAFDFTAGYIKVVKVVNNTHGGMAEPDDFNLTLGGNAVTSGVAVPVNPGTYTSAETLLSGYTFDGYSGDCDANGVPD